MTWAEAANVLQKKRHYARSLDFRGWGVSLCTESRADPAHRIVVMDQEALVRANPPRSRRTVKNLADLPLCLVCEGKAAREGPPEDSAA